LKSLSLILDTPLLVLFVVGAASREYISRHKKLTEFTSEDYDALIGLISNVQSVLVTPNTLTETSNLAAYIAEPARGEVFRILRAVIANSDEIYIPSRTAVQRREFVRLGLTDAALIEVASQEAAILTTDLNLYLAAQAAGTPAINFNHMRDRYL
jgi:predicted nucleic acid-binding protein